MGAFRFGLWVLLLCGRFFFLGYGGLANADRSNTPKNQLVEAQKAESATLVKHFNHISLYLTVHIYMYIYTYIYIYIHICICRWAGLGPQNYSIHPSMQGHAGTAAVSPLSVAIKCTQTRLMSFLLYISAAS